MSQSNWDKGFTAGAKAGRKGEVNSVCTLCCDGCKEHGERVERDRIIKLLEAEKFILPEGIDEGLTLMPIQEAIALIKGENK